MLLFSFSFLFFFFFFFFFFSSLSPFHMTATLRVYLIRWAIAWSLSQEGLSSLSKDHNVFSKKLKEQQQRRRERKRKSVEAEEAGCGEGGSTELENKTFEDPSSPLTSTVASVADKGNRAARRRARFGGERQPQQQCANTSEPPNSMIPTSTSTSTSTTS